MSSASPAMMERALERDNVLLPENAGAMAWRALVLVGLGLIAATFYAGWSENALTAKVALHAYHIGVVYAIGLSLGALGFVLIFHQTNAGWVSAIRRQFENLMSLIWVGGIMFGLLLVMQYLFTDKYKDGDAYLFNWMNLAKFGGDHLLEKKAGYLNINFFLVRAIIYFIVWLGLGAALYAFSRRQDTDGDKWHTARARKLSAVGLILFAFTTAFAGFDWLMSLDYHWYSTMFGVYFFAGNAVSTLSMIILVLLTLRMFGRLAGAFTEEHMHDLGKILFAFVVFWAYVGFSQYFLIWYANIPEETAYFLVRKAPGTPWVILSWALPIGHFIIPFLWLLPRPNRRSPWRLAVACILLLVMHGADLFFNVRPQAGEVFHWADATGIAGPILLMVGMIIRQVGRSPLIPLQDPRLPEALSHKNYV